MTSNGHHTSNLKKSASSKFQQVVLVFSLLGSIATILTFLFVCLEIGPFGFRKDKEQNSSSEQTGSSSDVKLDNGKNRPQDKKNKNDKQSDNSSSKKDNRVKNSTKKIVNEVSLSFPLLGCDYYFSLGVLCHNKGFYFKSIEYFKKARAGYPVNSSKVKQIDNNIRIISGYPEVMNSSVF
jgi:hypothetical protein